MNNNILVTSVSAGAGHVRAAQAVESYLKSSFNQVEHHDLMTFSKSWFKSIYADKYLDLVNHCPSLWKILYNLSDKPSLNINFKFRRWVEYQSHHRFFDYVKTFAPKAIISTHFMPPEILLRLKEKKLIDFKIFVVVTDFDVHYLWTHAKADHYFVAGNMAKEKLIKYGIEERNITISGIPIASHFFNTYALEYINSLHAKWQTNNNKKKVLLMAGGAGVTALDKIAKEVLSERNDIQFIALAGKNKKLLEKLKIIEKSYPDNLIAMGFTDKVHELMAISDLVMTKPGGLSTSECLAMNKPMVLVDPIPGQEEHNVIYLESLGVAKAATNISNDLQYVIEHLDVYKEAYKNIPILNSEKIIKSKVIELLK